jgi:hypothetical protein
MLLKWSRSKSAMDSMTPCANVKPRPPALCELVDDVVPDVEYRRVYEGILMYAHGSSPAVGRPDDAQAAPTFRRAEPLLLLAGLEPGLGGAEPTFQTCAPLTREVFASVWRISNPAITR